MKALLLLIALVWSLRLFGQTPVAMLKQGDECVAAGDYTQAALCFRSVLQEVAPEQGKALRTAALNSLALCHKQTGSYQEAADCYKEALGMIPSASAAAFRLRLNLCELYLRMGLYQQVIDMLADETPESEADRMALLFRRATAYGYLGQYEEALSLFDKAEKGASGVTGGEAVALQANKGCLYLGARQYAEARQRMEKALSLLEADGRETLERYIIQGNLALAEAFGGMRERATAHIDSCLDGLKQRFGTFHPDYIIALRKKAEIELAAGEKAAAAAWFKRYFLQEKHYIRRHFAFMTEKQRRDFWHSKREQIAKCYATEESLPEFLYDVALFDKALLLQTDLDIEKQLEGKPEWKARYLAVKQLHQRLQSRNMSRTERDSLERKASDEEERLMRELPDNTAYMESFDRSAASLRTALKSDKEFAVEWIRYVRNDTARYAALLLSRKGECRFVPLCTETALENYRLRDGKTLQQAVYSDKWADKRLLYGDSCLRHFIWEPLRQWLPDRCTLYFAADGLLHLLAIEYLCPERTDWKVCRLTSTGVLSARRPSRQHTGVPNALLFGGLDYNLCNDSVAGPSHKEFVNRTASRIIRETGIRIAAKSLPATHAETDSIAQCLGRSGVACRLYTGQWGGEEVFKRECNRYTILHIATHGYCLDNGTEASSPSPYSSDSIREDKSMFYSGMLFSGVNRAIVPSDDNDTKEDGILLASEAADLSMPDVEMAVLSACQTGLGRLTSDGVFGMQRGFKKAGVRALVISLWEVSDKATCLFMEAFYRYLAEGREVYDAFGMARDYLRNYVPPAAPARRVFSPTLMRYVIRPAVSSGERPYDKPEYLSAFILLDGNSIK